MSMRTNPPQFSDENITEILLRALELRDAETAGHSYRVAPLALVLGRTLGLTDQDLAILRLGAMLHDIGKLGVPDCILLKPSTLTEAERNIIKRHPDFGAELIYTIPGLKDASPIIKNHHERWDGTGYPSKLKGEDIPLLARICSVAEVMDALESEQVYRRAWSRSKTLRMIQEESGHSFDPTIVAALIEIMHS
jgi:putative nucleotidyltransferase with HDIG domain